MFPYPRAEAIPRSLLASAETVTKKTPSKSSRATNASTPGVKLQLKHQFGKLFQVCATPKAKAKLKPSSRVQLAHYIEVLTTEEAMSRIQEQDQKQQLAKSAKSRQAAGKTSGRRGRNRTVVQIQEKDKNTCQGCNGSFSDDNSDRQQTWVGCECCWRWYHHDCAGLTDMSEEDDPWACPRCS